MNAIKRIILGIFLVSCTYYMYAQDTIKEKEGKTGWNVGAIPVISFNTDLGLQYGALTNIYNYGDGKVYPMYYHSFYAEASMYTKGSGIFRIFYDSKFLIPGIRLTADMAYLPDQALDFYGFNGAQTVYNKDWKNDESPDYKTRMFYKHRRNMFRTKLDFQGKTGIKHVNWAAGLVLNNIVVSEVDIEKLNKGKEGTDALPDTATLFEHYVDWGIIKKTETTGGFFTSVKGGLVFDSRDNEPNPMKGIWSEAVISQTLNTDFNYTRLALTHRQYFTLIKNNLSFVYRIGYQGIIAGDAPFYGLPEMVFSYLPSSSSDGLGGSKSVRGMVRNRVVGNGVAYGNLEFRWKFAKFMVANQNLYLALSPFMDFGQVVQERKVIKPTNAMLPAGETLSDYFNEGKDKLHITYGSGLRIAMNQNFIIACDLGFPASKEDGDMGLYIGLNFLF